MSATIEKPRRANTPSTDARAERRGERDRQQAAQRLRERSQQREREQDRILFLLRRGAGVSTILRAIAQPNDSMAVSLLRAERLRRTLDAVAAGSEDADGVRIDARDLVRIVAYLDGRIRCLRDEIAQRKFRAARRRARQNQRTARPTARVSRG